MKFIDPKTGKVFEYTRDAINAYCGKECEDCPIAIENNQKHLFCFEYVSKFPTEAARLMGYEVIEDSSSDSSTEIDDTPTTLDDTPTVSNDTPTKEDDMDKQDKPLSEWTLGEIRKICDRYGCSNYPFHSDGDPKCIVDITPNGWNLEYIPQQRVKISNDTRLILQILQRAYPWAGYVSRSRGDVTRSVGALRLHERRPEATEKGFAPTGLSVELPPEFLPEVPEGVMVGIETLMEVSTDET